MNIDAYFNSRGYYFVYSESDYGYIIRIIDANHQEDDPVARIEFSLGYDDIDIDDIYVNTEYEDTNHVFEHVLIYNALNFITKCYYKRFKSVNYIIYSRNSDIAKTRKKYYVKAGFEVVRKITDIGHVGIRLYNMSGKIKEIKRKCKKAIGMRLKKCILI